jgi:hypothetical protein
MCCDKYAYFYHRDSIIEHAGTDLIDREPVLIWQQLEPGGGGGGDDDGRGQDGEHVSVRDERGQHASGITIVHSGTDLIELDPVLRDRERESLLGTLWLAFRCGQLLVWHLRTSLRVTGLASSCCDEYSLCHP